MPTRGRAHTVCWLFAQVTAPTRRRAYIECRFFVCANSLAIEEHQWIIKTKDPKVTERILDYNEDDCRAMRVVLDAMRGMRAGAYMEGGEVLVADGSLEPSGTPLS